MKFTEKRTKVTAQSYEPLAESFIVLDKKYHLPTHGARGDMRNVMVSVVVLLLCCCGSLLLADYIPLVSESMPALGDVESFVMYGDYAVFIGGEHHLQIMDFSDAQHPQLVASFDAPGISGTGKWITINGQYAYLFFPDCIAIISLDNPLSPQFQARIELDGVISQSIHDDILYLARGDWDTYLYAYSLDSPLAPQLLDSLLVTYYPVNIACGDGFLVCGSYDGTVVDTTDPANLQVSYELHFPSGFEYGRNSAFAVSGTTLVVGCGYYVHVYDFSQTPYFRSSVNLPFEVRGIKGYIYNNRFWCEYLEPNDSPGILGVDFSDLDAPQICYSETLPNNAIFPLYMDAQLMSLRTNAYARYVKFCMLDGDSMPSFDLSYPLDSIYNIISRGDWTVGVNSSNFIQILGFDVAETAYPQFSIGSEYYSYMNIHNNTLLYTIFKEPYQNGLHTSYLVLFDLASRTQKAELELGFSYWGGEITLDGDKAYICNKHEGLFVVDISNVEQPLLLSHLQENIEYQCAVAEGGKLWVGSGITIRCYDVSQSTTPIFLYEIPLYMQTPLIRPHRMVKIDNYLYAITLGSYLARLKLGVGGADEIIIKQTRYSPNTNLLELGEGLLVGSCDGLSVFNIQDLSQLKEVAFRDVERVIEGDYIVLTSYAVNGDRIYVGQGKSLQVLDASTAIAFTRLDTPEADQELVIFPNPGKGKINVICKLPTDKEAELELYNLRGQKVFSRTFSSSTEGLSVFSLDTKDNVGRMFGSGVYFVRLKQDGYQQTGKLVITK